MRAKYDEDGAIERGPRVSRRIIVVAALGIASVAGGGILVHGLTGPAKISLSANSGRAQHEHSMRATGRWSFSTLNNQNDPTFNQLLGINDRGQIAGYFGSGAQNHPNKGYQLNLAGRAMYRNENFPGALQTQVVGINDVGVSVGFWSGQNTASMANNNFGFYAWDGSFHSVSFPVGNNASPPVNQLLGVNNRDMAVGFYTNGQGASRGYEYSIRSHRFSRVLIPGVRNLSPKVSLTATSINNRGDVVGFYSVSGGTTHSFLKTAGGHFTKLSYPGAASTQAFGVNDSREVVGTYMTGSGNNAKSFGFTWTSRSGFRSVSDPQGLGATTINGVNDAGDLVGFYTDAAGNTDGLLWARSHHTAPVAPSPGMSSTPTMSATPTMAPTPTTSVMPTTSATAKPSMTPTTAPPASSASPSGGPW